MHFKRTCLLYIFLLCTFLQLQAQAIQIKGTILSVGQTPIQGATIEYEKGKGVVSDANGNFEFTTASNQSMRLLVKSLGYQDMDTTIQVGAATIYLVLVLQEQFYDQPTITITEDITSIFEKTDWTILDLVAHQQSFFILYMIGPKRFIGLANQKGIITDQVKLETRVYELYNSCSNRLYLRSSSGIQEVSKNQNALILSEKVYDTATFRKFLAPCLYKTDKYQVFKSYSDHNKRIHYFSYDQDKQQQLIYEVFDKVAYKTARAYYNDIIQLYYQFTAAPKANAIDEGEERVNIIVKGEWDGDLNRLILNNTIHEAVSYYQNVESLPLKSFEFVQEGGLYILDMLDQKIIRYGLAEQSAEGLTPPTGFDWKDIKKLLVDQANSEVYVLFENGTIHLIQVSGTNCTLKKVLELDADLIRIGGLQIYDHTLYFFQRPNVSESLHQIKKVKL